MEWLFGIFSLIMLYASLVGQRVSQTFSNEGKADAAKYIHEKSNSNLLWALGWAFLALCSVSGLMLLFTILAFLMLISFVLGL